MTFVVISGFVGECGVEQIVLLVSEDKNKCKKFVTTHIKKEYSKNSNVEKNGVYWTITDPKLEYEEFIQILTY